MRAAALLTAAAMLLAAAGCGSPAENRKRLVKGTSADVPSARKPWVKVRNLFVLGPDQDQLLRVGADAPVYAYLTASATDKLVSVSSPAFSGSRIVGGAVDLPAGRLVELQSDDRPRVVLTGLAGKLQGAEQYPLTLVFERAGRVQVGHVPVIKRRQAYATYPPAP
ncbi:copper chaperone PCu(A)C [Actinomadura hibisca]|uniref:copper chaperone PCu(A)C n=1 Tax=Actinomadura hibisca TaxID=68565 RepID=UPI0008363FB7|nr:copper chaperone PCu(A)C [Actinomadura hibisca]